MAIEAWGIFNWGKFRLVRKSRHGHLGVWLPVALVLLAVKIFDPDAQPGTPGAIKSN